MRNKATKLAVLFRLVKSLSVADVKIFQKLEQNRETNLGYNELFNALRKLSELNEKIIFDDLGALGYSEKQIRDFGNYLFIKLLRVLQIQRDYNFSEASSLLSIAEIFKDLNERNEYQKTLKKLKEKAKEEELFELEALAVRKQIELGYNHNFRLIRGAKAQQLLREQLGAIEKQKNLFEYSELFHQANLLLDKKWLSSFESQHQPQLLKLILSLETHPLLQNEDLPKSDSAYLYFLAVHQILVRLREDRKRDLELTKRIIRFIEKKQILQKRFSSLLMRNCSRAAIGCVRTNDLRSYHLFQAKLESMSFLSGSEEKERLIHLLNIRLFYTWETGDVASCKSLVLFWKNSDRQLADFRSHLKYNLYLFLVNFFLSIGNHKEGLACVKKISQEDWGEIPPNQETIFRLLQIFLSIETGDKEFALSRVVALDKYLKRNGGPPEEWAHLRRQLRKACTVFFQDEEKEIWSNYLQTISKTRNTPNFALPFDIILYCKGKISGRTIFQEKFINRQ